MTDESDILNDVERSVRDTIKARLGDKGTIVGLRQQGDRIEVEVVSPNDFSAAARLLEQAGSEAATKLQMSIDVQLKSSWRKK